MQSARLLARLQREITMLKTDPPPGVCAWPHNDLLTHLQAQIQGPANTVYSRGLFKLDVQVPERYPFEPPSVRFVTPIYHPNIDSAGRICLDILNMPPKGAWKPSLNIPTVLTSIGLLLSEPNPDDGLMGDITAEYKHRRSSFDRKARQMTEQHALPSLRQDTGDQNITSTSSIVKTVPLDGKVSNSTPSADGKCDMKMLGGDHLAPDNQASSSGRCKVSEAAAATPGRQRLALGRKLSLTKSEQLSADVQAKQQHPSPSRPLAVEGNENLPPANLGITTKRQEDDIQPAHQKTPSKCKATSQVQNLDPNLPRSNESGLTSKPTSDQSAKPSRLSLLSRLKMSRPRLSQQKPPSSTPHQSSLSVVKEAECTVVSDSESDSEEIPAPRSRLSLTQRGFAGKRKASLL